jgi:hypothetical protein
MGFRTHASVGTYIVLLDLVSCDLVMFLKLCIILKEVDFGSVVDIQSKMKGLLENCFQQCFWAMCRF